MALGTQIYVYDPETGALTDLTEDVGAGFGDASNKYAWSGYMFDGNGDGVDELYIGTWNVQPDIPGALNAFLRVDAMGGTDALRDSGDLSSLALDDFASPLKSEGGEIWQYDFTTQAWTEVLDASHDGLDDGDPGFREIKEFNGKLYAATARPANMSDNTTKMFVSDDGVTWTEIQGGPLDPENGNSSIRTMQVVQGPDGADVLIVGTSNYDADAQIWTYSDDGTWTYVASMEPDTISDFFVDEDGDLYVTTWNGYEMHKVDLAQAGTDAALTDVTPDYSDTAGPETELGIIEITYFEGYYYVGSANYAGTSLIRTQTLDDPDSWEVITTDGFVTYGDGQDIPALGDDLADLGITSIGYTWQMYDLDGYLYIGTFTIGGAPVLLRSDQGTDWEMVDATFSEDAYGIRTMIPVALDADGLPTDGDATAMIIGTASPFNEMVPQDQLLSYPGGTYSGTYADDDMRGTSGEDVLIGYSGNDEMAGGAEDDLLLGDLGLPADAGNDLLHGNDGDDIVMGAGGDDRLFGNDGEDTVVGGAGADALYGGAGNDLLIGDLFLDDKIVALLKDFGLIDPDGQSANSQVNALLTLQSLWTTDDTTRLRVLLGEDAYQANVDAMAAGNDTIRGGDGADTALAGGGADLFWGGNGSDVGYGGTGADRLWGGEGDDFLFGEQGRDRLTGDDGNDLLNGGNGDDVLIGGRGHDSLYGGSGVDALVGGTREDFLQGWAGNDRLTGGAGADVFSLGDDAAGPQSIVTGDDIIFDFQDGIDRIDLGGIAIDPLTFARDLAAATTQRSASATQIDLDQLGGDGSVILVGVTADQIDASDFTGDFLLI
ncbi:MAG: hypothetical protein CML65_16110 [Rhodobacteraceae bacterium]|nr:hypothetical protein [Paracoccaceae bacterium]